MKSFENADEEIQKMQVIDARVTGEGNNTFTDYEARPFYVRLEESGTKNAPLLPINRVLLQVTY